MKITKFPQANFLIEEGKTRILIDPGFLTFEKFAPVDFGKLNAILASHRHFDHVDYEAAKIWSREGVQIFGNSDVVEVLGEEGVRVNEIAPEQEFEIGDFRIKTVSIPHCKLLFCKKCAKQLLANEILPKVKRCKVHPDDEPEKVDGPPNTGFVIDDVLFHPGDGIELEDLAVENACIPINGPTIDFDRAWKFAKSLEAKRVIPMHYSHPTFAADPAEFAKQNKFGIDVKILADGESLKI